MSNENLQHIHKPIILRIVELNKLCVAICQHAYKLVRHSYVETLLSHANIIYMLAFRQLRGKDTHKRIVETLEELQAQVYFLAALDACGSKYAAMVDELVDDILEQTGKVRSASLCQSRQST